MATVYFYSPHEVTVGHEIVYCGWSLQLKLCQAIYNVIDKKSVISGYIVVYETPYLTQEEADNYMMGISKNMEAFYARDGIRD